MCGWLVFFIHNNNNNNSACAELKKLNVSHNQLDSVSSFSSNTALTWLDISNNCIPSLRGIERLKKLVVLNASHNKIARIDYVAALTGTLRCYLL